MDLDKDYIDIEDARRFRDSPEHKRDTQSEAQRLYDAWQKLIPTLILPFLAYLNKSAGRLTTSRNT